MSVLDRDTITVARQVVITVGGRYSTELGIDVDGGVDGCAIKFSV